MGGGNERPNQPVAPRRSGGLLTEGGYVALKCPSEDTSALAERVDADPGTRGVLRVVGKSVSFVVRGRVLGTLVGPEVDRLARCLEREFRYEGELVYENGDPAVHYWNA